MKTKKLYTIFNQRLAGFLMMNGFPLLKLTPNLNNNKNCFVFGNTAMLQDFIEKWQIERLKNKENR